VAQQVLVIGAGFAGLSAACSLAQLGYDVRLLEQHDSPGGRARQFHADGFTFDMGPSWYWMPDVFERFFGRFGYRTADFYELIQLDPAFRMYWQNAPATDIPADYEAIRATFEAIEPGSARRLDQFMTEAAYKYRVGINKLVYKPGRSLGEFVDWELMTGVARLQVFTSIAQHVRRYFSDPRLIQLMEFPILFLGALPDDTPALYSLMNYASLKLGTWYPKGGMYKIVAGMAALAERLGVQFEYNTQVQRIDVQQGLARGVETDQGVFPADIIVAGADYHHVDDALLPPQYRMYSPQYWETRTLAPSSMIYYLGLGTTVPELPHHTLFFDTDFARHAEAIYKRPDWPESPLFYVCAPSRTDASVAPAGHENLFVLIPTAPGLEDTEAVREQYFREVMQRLAHKLGRSLEDAVIYRRSYANSDFVRDYHALRGNAYGLANTLRQTALLKPSLRNRKVRNLFYTGQLTVPGPGVPPSLISGQVVADEVAKAYPRKTAFAS
jgi:phytoene desaturase